MFYTIQVSLACERTPAKTAAAVDFVVDTPVHRQRNCLHVNTRIHSHCYVNGENIKLGENVVLIPSGHL